jgi:hypothetical protein
MGYLLRPTMLFGICLLMGACSSAPPPVPAPAPAAAPPAAGAPPRVYLEDKTLTNDEVKKLFAQGYKPTSRNGEVYYCRKEGSLGTRFETTTCRTAQQMKELERESKDLVLEKQRPGGCTNQGPAC